ncbi:lipopolysaccharide assembly protein LapB [Piscinibacter terrae]|uniref:Lipopolysaccharide assembly protein B n=1 Tax=Piscinibacter terrae TaxID=2496871 RepID=A0A3N7JYQ9_9BURK|nr:lipopolysaccharide assembly protein LapB [Albitalea terrae]RQP25939.1 lipopolysaccharide assembly protein LapB [Albitalea terrae]
MDFDLQWVLLGLPVAFALGWMASRLDLRQWRREQRDSPKAYFKGLNFLLNEQQDKAIDAFIEAVQHDPDTSDLHFALGNLFRRRGEYERAVRVHEHLLKRADLPAAERDRAQHGLAQDYIKAGLFDRAEEAWKALEGTAFDTEARLALLTLHERSRDWRAAVEDATKLDRTGSTGSYASRIAHYWCELAQEADGRGQTADADEALRKAREAAPQAARPMVLAGHRARQAGQHAQALEAWRQLVLTHPEAFTLVARDFASSAIDAGQQDKALQELRTLYDKLPSLDLLAAINLLDAATESQRTRVSEHLRKHPSLSAARELLRLRTAERGVSEEPDVLSIQSAIAHAAKPLQRYRCAACGFEAQNYFWQCPGCLNWDSYPTQRLEDL